MAWKLNKVRKLTPEEVREKIAKYNPGLRLAKLKSGPARVLHLLPPGIDSPELKFHGSTKDFRNRTEYFEDRGIAYHELIVPRKEALIAQFLDGFERDIRPLSSYEFILLDIPGSFSRAVADIKRRAPAAKVIFRSHNAEFFHRLDWARAEQTVGRKALWRARALRALWKDYRTLRSADQVTSICDWDNDAYWKRIGDWAGTSERAVTWHYFLPTALEPKAPPVDKELLCVCLGAPHKGGDTPKHGPIIADLYERFSKSVESLPASPWRFAVTGLPPEGTTLGTRVEVLGFLDSPFSALERAKVVWLPTELGRGFKTKILDAVVAGCFVILPQDLFSRLPEEIKPFCLPYHDDTPEEWQRCLRLAEGPLPDIQVNQILRARAFAEMDRVFLGPSSSR